MNLMMLLEMAAQSAPDRLAIGTLEGGLTYGRMYELAGGAAASLREMPADRVLYTDVSSPTLPVALFGSSWAGKPFVPVSYRLADDRLRMIVTRQAPALLLHGHGVDGGSRTAGIDGVEQMSTDRFIATADSAGVPDADWSYDESDVAVLLHTSGTSGDPKVAVLRQKHLVSYVFGSVEFLGAGEDEATLVSVPPYHIAGMAGILTATYGGRRLVQLPDFEPQQWVRIARQEHITHAMVVPTMLARILEVLEGDGEGLPDLRHLAYGGGRMPMPVIEQALRLLPNVGFVNAYGLTETSSSVTVLGPDDHRTALTSDDEAVRARLGSVGQALPTIELSIRDPLGVPVPSGQRGEVWVRGEQVSGEYGSSTTTDNEGWFPTKDAGRLDADGYLFLEGRIDDVIIRGGENLSPGEIEDVLLMHDGIRDAVVLGVPDTEWGEVVAAVVVAVPGHTVDGDEVRAWVAKHLRSSRAPAIVEVRDELPYTDTGKVLRRLLKPELVERYSK
jgi:fatty-acyl-CoA synthase